jgi:catechol 2,3-dioxygenase-like lactoylglutathione lyase family enzyme
MVKREGVEMRALVLAIAAFALVGCVTVNATVAPETLAEERIPIDLRRTTLVVRDIEASLALYRDALGLQVEYDQSLTSPRLGRADSDGVNRSRLVLLSANNDYIGMLGLWQFLDQTAHDRRAPDAADFTPGDIVLLFNADDVDAAFARASAVPGVTVVSPPAERRYPSPQGDIVVIVSMLTDADGHTVELNQLISDPRRQ